MNIGAYHWVRLPMRTYTSVRVEQARLELFMTYSESIFNLMSR